MRCAPVVVLLGLSACGALVTDPSRTGVAIAPAPGEFEGPVTLVVVNRTDDVLVCTAWEEDLCPVLSEEDKATLGALEPGERWQRKDVACALLDVSCAPVGAANDELPTRSWSWFIEDTEEG